jgi:hypothetical protein
MPPQWGLRWPGDNDVIEARDMVGLLRQLVDECEGGIWEAVRSRIAANHSRFSPLADWVVGEYSDPAKRRWYDPLHIAHSTHFALDLIESGEADSLVLPAILLHDMGYFAIRDKDAWNRPEVRVTHMQEGAALAAEVLAGHGLTPAELGRVVGMVATHDNPYLGYPLEGADRLTLRDCDRVWVMHLVSFYKDWSSKKGDDPNRKTNRLLALRRVHFYGEEALNERQEWGIDEAVWEEGRGRVERPALVATRNRVARLFERRRTELEDTRLWRDGESFLAYARQVMTTE